MNLKAAAIIKGLKGKDIAKHFGVSENTVSKWLRREMSVPDKRKRAFADLLGITVDDLLPPETHHEEPHHGTAGRIEEQDEGR